MELTDDIRQTIHAQLTARPAAPCEIHATPYNYKPHASEALAINPEDIPRATANLRAHGCFVNYDSEGRPIITSERQYREIAKAQGLWNGRDGFRAYGEDGKPVLTGRESARMQKEFRRRVERGEISF